MASRFWSFDIKQINMLDRTVCKMKICQNVTANTETPPLLTAHWLESEAIAGFRVWQIIFLCFASVLAVVIILCCCIRFRIPRTKQEIEADYIRKKITKKFQKQLKTIQNSDMDEMDLKRALDRIRADFRSDTESLAQSEALSEATLCSDNFNRLIDSAANPGNGSECKNEYNFALSPRDLTEKERITKTKFATLAATLAKLTKSAKPHEIRN